MIAILNLICVAVFFSSLFKSNPGKTSFLIKGGTILVTAIVAPEFLLVFLVIWCMFHVKKKVEDKYRKAGVTIPDKYPLIIRVIIRVAKIFIWFGRIIINLVIKNYTRKTA